MQTKHISDTCNSIIDTKRMQSITREQQPTTFIHKKAVYLQMKTAMPTTYLRWPFIDNFSF